MITGSAVFEVLALFAVALLVCWPAMRRYLPNVRGREASPAGAGRPNRARFEPRSAQRRAASEELPQVTSALPSDGVYDSDETPLLARGRVGSIDDFGAGDDRDGAVLPLAEALLRGERVRSSPSAMLDINDKTNGRQSVASEPTVAAQAAPHGEPFKVLLIDSRDKFRTSMLLKLARAGHRVFPVAEARDAINVFMRERADLVQIHRDVLLEAGVEFVRRIRAQSPHVPILVHGGRHGAGDVGRLKHGVDITVVTTAGDDADVLVEMIDCSLVASRNIRRVRDDQEVRSTILSELCFHLRSSLDVISGYTEILSDQPDLSPFREMLDSMRVSTNSATIHMQSCVDVALDAPESARSERFDLSTLSERIRRLVSRQIGTHPLRLTTTGPVQGSALFTDGEKLLTILSHVIADAIKFTPTGEINLSVRSVSDHTDFVVTDAGPGISADVPMPFAPVPPPGGGDGASASGVGLAIAERLSRSIGATLTGTCGEGGAAAFTISVPAKLLTQGPEAVSLTVH